MQQETIDARKVVEEELKYMSPGRLSAAIRNTGAAVTVAGIIEIAFGAAAIISPAFSGALFVMLLGGAVLVSGVINILASMIFPSAGRLAQGVIACAAGVLVVAHPLFGLGFLAVLAAVYLVATGIARFFEPPRDALTIMSGIVGIVFGLVVLLSLPNPAPFLVGLLIGINLIANGIHGVSAGLAVQARVRK